MTNKIIEAARAANVSITVHEGRPGGPWTESHFVSPNLERFYAIAFAAGMERAAEICDEQMASGQLAPLEQHRASFIACVIRAHAQNQPENEHDTDDM